MPDLKDEREDVKLEEADNEKKDTAIEVDLNKPSEDKTQVSSEPKYVTVDELEKIRKQLNGLSYLGRQFHEFSKKLDSIQAAPVPRYQISENGKDPYDELVEKDWKRAVRQLAREEAEALRQAQIQAEYAKSVEQKKVGILEESKQKVLERYPELQDQNSEVSRRYMTILNKNQDYLQNERGPLLAMRDMEEELREEGRLDEFTKRAVEKEVTRQIRGNVSGVPRGNSSNGNSARVTLTREQKEVCDQNNIRYEDYAKMLKKSSSRQGVEV